MIKKHNKGFTLVEIIVSIALLAIIALFMLPMSIYAFKFSKWNNIKLTAMNLAHTQLEWVKTLDYKNGIGLDEIGYSPKGEVKQHLFLNELNSDPKVVEGIEYKFLTSIYWESGISTTGELVANATKKIDVSVKARNPITGEERYFEVIGSLVAFEGERTLSSYIPFRARAITGEDFTTPAKNVKIIVNGVSGSLFNWSRTDEEGEAIFVELPNGTYYVFPEEWEGGEMLSRPTGKTGSLNDEEWIFQEKVIVQPTEDEYIDILFYVDQPGRIILNGYSDELLNNTLVNVKPSFVPEEGENPESYSLNTYLKKLLVTKIWRNWSYDFILKNDDEEYFFVEIDNGNLWEGNFNYIEGEVTKKELKLAYGLKDGSFKVESDDSLTLSISLTTPVNNLNSIEFSLNDENDLLFNNISIIPNPSNNGVTINLKPDRDLNSDILSFMITNKDSDELVNNWGMKLIQDRNYCDLIKAE